MLETQTISPTVACGRQVNARLSIAIWAFAVTVAAASSVYCDDSPIRPDERIQQSIAALGAREFDSRDRAMRELIALGAAAIDPVREITGRRDQEIATRGVLVLKGIGESGSLETLEAALAALHQIVTAGGAGPAARRATEAQSQLESIRQQRTVEFFRELGADIQPEFVDLWAQTVTGHTVFAIELGPQWKGTERDLERLKWLRDVEQISLVGPQVQDGWLKHLQGMPALYSVKIKHANISPKGIEELAKLQRLRMLRLMFVPMGDEMVAPLQKCESLLRLVVISQKLTDNGEAQLKERFEERVECPRGAMLGVRAGTEEPWTIREVVPASAAEKAGLKVGDRIVKFNGEPVATFLELRTMIGKCMPGDSAGVEVDRDGEVLNMKITFGEWD